MSKCTHINVCAYNKMYVLTRFKYHTYKYVPIATYSNCASIVNSIYISVYLLSCNIFVGYFCKLFSWIGVVVRFCPRVETRSPMDCVKMQNKSYWSVIRLLFLERKSRIENQERLYPIYGDYSPSMMIMKYWFIFLPAKSLSRMWRLLPSTTF